MIRMLEPNINYNPERATELSTPSKVENRS